MTFPGLRGPAARSRSGDAGAHAFGMFTGISENSPQIRACIVKACAWLGITLDVDANQRGAPCISAAGSAVPAWVVPTNEELVIARHTRALVKDMA